jgi:RNA-directed DNA polymerase
MKRLRVDLFQLAARDNLALAAFKAARGKRQRTEVVDFLAHLDVRLAALATSILGGQAPTGQARQFFIHDPKQRQITAPCFADRVLHHAIFNVAEARLEAALTDVAFACRPGRGVHAAVWAVQSGLCRFPWLVQVDVAHYFDNIHHATLMGVLARRFKGADFLALLARVVAQGGDSQRGLPIGALTSQHFANAYLDSADRLLMAQPGVGAAVRYMDDMVWFCATREVAKRSLAVLRQHVTQDLGLTLKDRVVLRPSAQGLLFCGYRIRQGVVLAGPRKIKRFRQAVQRLNLAEAQGIHSTLLQRAHDASAAALLPAKSLGLKQSLWWPGQLPSAAGCAS